LTQLAYVAPEQDSVDVQLDRLLILWHEVTSEYRTERTYNVPSFVLSYQSPKHNDWRHHEIGDELEDKTTASVVGICIDRLEQPWQTAIRMQARNLATGHAVWFSPRLPADKEAREVILLEARNMLLVQLRREGVMQ
jgi:hypothetical protein